MPQCRWRNCIRVKLHYHIDYCQGPEHLGESTPWVVLLNGLFADISSYENVVQDYTPHFNVLRFDGRGQGASPSPQNEEGHTLEDQVLDMEQLFRDLDLFDKNIFLVGLSNGGRLALEFARRHPDCVKALAACNVYHKMSPMLAMKLESWLKAQSIGGPFHRFDIAAPWIWGETVLNQNPDLIDTYRKRADKQCPTKMEALIKGAINSCDIDLSEIKSKTLLIAGNEDLLTPIFTHKIMAKEIENSHLEIVDGGHASLLEFPKNHKDKIIPFLLQEAYV